jgi:signal transduction histidine kinase
MLFHKIVGFSVAACILWIDEKNIESNYRFPSIFMVDFKINKEQRRLEVLHQYDILDTPPDGAFDDIVKLAARLLDVPVAIISLVDKDRIWFKSKIGVELQQIEKEEGLCASAIFSDDIYLVEEATKDPRTLANKLVAGSFGLEFYAAAPLTTTDGYNLGTLCVMDKKPRKMTPDQQEVLKSLAKVVMNQMELRLHARMSVKNHSELIYLLTHNLKGFINNIPALIEALRESRDDPGDFEWILKMLEQSALKSAKEINEFLDRAPHNNGGSSYVFKKVDFTEIIKQVVKVNQIAAIDKNQQLKIDLDNDPLIINADKNKLMDAVDNLINNAIKYSPYNSAINISTYSKENKLILEVRDEGQGLSATDKEGLFKPFSRLSTQPTGGETSSGIGLWIVKEIIGTHYGKVWAVSEGPNQGSTFFIELELVE